MTSFMLNSPDEAECRVFGETFHQINTRLVCVFLLGEYYQLKNTKMKTRELGLNLESHNNFQIYAVAETRVICSALSASVFVLLVMFMLCRLGKMKRLKNETVPFVQVDLPPAYNELYKSSGMLPSYNQSTLPSYCTINKFEV